MAAVVVALLAPAPSHAVAEKDLPTLRYSIERPMVGNRRVPLHVWQFSPKQAAFRLVPATKAEGMTVADALQVPGAVLALNGGYFDYREQGTTGPAMTPTGLVIADGVTLVGRRSGSGVLYDKNGSIGIAWSREEADWRGAQMALQNGPLLVDPGGVPGIRTDSGRAARRTVICLLRSGDVQVVIADQPVTLFALARALAERAPQGLDCERAINLDGGPSTQAIYQPVGDDAVSIPGSTWVVNALVVVPRKTVPVPVAKPGALAD